MSSLAATQADGYYVPPEYYESGAYKKQSKNQWHQKQQTPNKKGGGHNQYERNSIVRFELPYDGFCESCQSHVMRGTRYNAQKIDTKETYFTTKIWEFRMKCRACSNCEFVIRTDPQARGFSYVSGIHKQEKEWTDESEGTGVIETEQGEGVVLTNIERLEKTQHGQRASLSELDRLKALQQLSQRTYYNDADGNAAIRSSFRVDRKNRKRRLKEGAALGWREGIPLLDNNLEDKSLAMSVTFGDGKQQERKRLNKLRQGSIFNVRKKRRCKETDDPRPDNVTTTPRSTRTSRRKRAADDTDDITTVNLMEEARSQPKTVRKIAPQGPWAAKSNLKTTSSALEALAAYSSDSD